MCDWEELLEDFYGFSDDPDELTIIEPFTEAYMHLISADDPVISKPADRCRDYPTA